MVTGKPKLSSLVPAEPQPAVRRKTELESDSKAEVAGKLGSFVSMNRPGRLAEPGPLRLPSSQFEQQRTGSWTGSSLGHSEHTTIDQ